MADVSVASRLMLPRLRTFPMTTAHGSSSTFHTHGTSRTRRTEATTISAQHSGTEKYLNMMKNLKGKRYFLNLTVQTRRRICM